MVRHIARSKDSWYTGGRGLVENVEVTVAGHAELPLEELRVWIVTDGDEGTGAGNLLVLSGDLWRGDRAS